MGALGPNHPINVPLSLIRAKCFPIITYGIEAIHFSVSDIKKFSFAYNNIFYKLFKSHDANVIGQCQYFCYIWPFYALYEFLTSRHPH